MNIIKQSACAQRVKKASHDRGAVLPELFWTQRISRVRPERSADHGAAGGKGTARPPDVQRGDMPMAYAFLTVGVFANLLYREIHFDEALRIGGHKVLAYYLLFIFRVHFKSAFVYFLLTIEEVLMHFYHPLNYSSKFSRFSSTI